MPATQDFTGASGNNRRGASAPPFFDEGRMKLSERCAIHAEKMNDEGWYVTANILAAAAEILNESDSDMPPEAFTALRKSRYS